MRKLIRSVAVLAALGVAAPVWAQTATSDKADKDSTTEKKTTTKMEKKHHGKKASTKKKTTTETKKDSSGTGSTSEGMTK